MSKTPGLEPHRAGSALLVACAALFLLGATVPVLADSPSEPGVLRVDWEPSDRAARAASPGAWPAPNDTGVDVYIEGDVTVEFNHRDRTMRVRIDRVTNLNSSTWSPIAVRIRANAGPMVLGGTNSGPLILNYSLPALGPRASLDAIDTGWQAYTAPTDGTYFIPVTISRQNGDGSWSWSDFRNVKHTVFGTSVAMSQRRVSVSGTYRNPYSGETGALYPTRLNEEFSFFDFQDPTNPEIFVKVLGGNDPDYLQLFVGGTTNFEYSINFAGCGRSLTFTKPAYETGGYANGSAIAKSGCQAACTYGVSPSSLSFGAAGGTGAVNVTAQTGCAWTATSGVSWVTVTSGASGSGVGTVGIAVAANSGTSSRTGTVTIAGQPVAVTQTAGTGPASYDGNWSGTTSQGKPISFSVASNAFTVFSIGWSVSSSGCSGSGTTSLTYTVPKAITGTSFTISSTGSGPSALSFTVNGTFGSSGTASGTATFNYVSSYPNPSCTASGSATWTATKQ